MVPEGWPYYRAWQQVAEFLNIVEEYAAKYDINIAIEPLRRKECNILNFVSEALAVSALTKLPHVGVLGDTFHMLCGGEPWDAMKNAGDKLWHVHISHELADLSSRIYPYENDGTDYEGIFKVLKDMNYAGDVSVEAGCSDFAKDGAEAVKVLRKYIG
jgi:sugar phosphate isomerase/epimerase